MVAAISDRNTRRFYLLVLNSYNLVYSSLALIHVFSSLCMCGVETGIFLAG